MITVDLARRGPATRRLRVLSQFGSVALASALVLTGCQIAGTEGGYIDAYFDNDDPIYAPLKDTLFDGEGAALCAIPIYKDELESRFRSFNEKGGLINSFLFEVVNNEQSPDAPLEDLPFEPLAPQSADESDAEYTERARQHEEDIEKYRVNLERRLGSLDRMYQLTHPFLYDQVYDISSPEDLAPLKEQLRAASPEMVAGAAPVAQFVNVGDAWIESSAGRYEVGKIGDVELFIETLGVDVEFDGLNNDYFSALKDGEQFLMIRSRDTAVVTLVSPEGEADIDEIQQFQQYELLQEPGFLESAAAIITLQNDGCPQGGDTNFARWWVSDVQFVEPASDEDPFANPDPDPFADDDEADPSASPSPSPSPTAG